mmetsp:Transcript_37271/g.105225  ORF Transcript_37271/g.105225 Transcript_37271/m.105225 type:complete len:159 (+) Transcript_37271:102-578(+)
MAVRGLLLAALGCCCAGAPAADDGGDATSLLQRHASANRQIPWPPCLVPGCPGLAAAATAGLGEVVKGFGRSKQETRDIRRAIELGKIEYVQKQKLAKAQEDEQYRKPGARGYSFKSMWSTNIEDGDERWARQTLRTRAGSGRKPPGNRGRSVDEDRL